MAVLADAQMQHSWKQPSGTKQPYSFVDMRSALAHLDQERWTESGDIAKAAEEYQSLMRALEVFHNKTADGDAAQQEALAALMWEFGDIFVTDPGIVLANSDVRHHIDTGDARPIRASLRRGSQHESEVIKQHVAKMLTDGAIRKCSSPWAARVVLTRKPDGSWRFCTDYARLGKITKRDCYPLPRIDNILDATAGATWMSTHDLSSGYWQTPMATEDKSDLKTAFVTEQGQFCWKVMPFGLRNS